MSALLNLTDGLLTQLVKLHIIATLNSRQDQLDKALLRPGRLRSFKTIDRLSHERARAVAEHHNRRLGERRDYSLAEIFASEEFGALTADAKDPKKTIGF